VSWPGLSLSINERADVPAAAFNSKLASTKVSKACSKDECLRK